VGVARVGVLGAVDGGVGPEGGWAAAGYTVGEVGGGGAATCDDEPGAHATPTVASMAHCTRMNRIRMFMAVCAGKAARLGNAGYGPDALAIFTLWRMHVHEPIVQLVVYLASHCDNCGEAHRLAELAAEQNPAVRVRVVDVDIDSSQVPEYIVAVPTYVINGRVIALGNPVPEELMAHLRAAVA
jgi:Thioredoxin domain